MRQTSLWTRTVAVVSASAFCLALSAQPALAAAPAPVDPAQAPVAAAAAARVAALTPAELASVSASAAPAQTSDAAPTTASPSFFRTGKGVAVLVLLVAGVGYASYSAVHDRNPVKSPIR